MKAKGLTGVLIFAMVSSVGCDEWRSVDRHARFPDIVSPIYVVDMFDLPEPRLIDLGSEGIYILPEPLLESIKTKGDLVNHDGVFMYFDQSGGAGTRGDILNQYIPKWMEIHDFDFYRPDFGNPYSIIHESYFGLNDIAEQIEAKFGFPVYEFVIKPKTYALLLASDPSDFSYGADFDFTQFEEDGIIMSGDVPDLYEYSKDYMLMVAPIFSVRDIKTITGGNSRYQ